MSKLTINRFEKKVKATYPDVELICKEEPTQIGTMFYVTFNVGQDILMIWANTNSGRFMEALNGHPNRRRFDIEGN